MSKQRDHVAQTKVLSLNDYRDKTFFGLYQNHSLHNISVDSCLFSGAHSCTLHKCVCVCVFGGYWVKFQLALRLSYVKVFGMYFNQTVHSVIGMQQ